MSTYYNGNIEADLANISEDEDPLLLQAIGRRIGYGRAQQILQIMWADDLRKQGLSMSGALYPKDPK